MTEQLIAMIDDFGNYDAPVMLPNGDILIRRNAPLVPNPTRAVASDSPLHRTGEIELYAPPGSVRSRRADQAQDLLRRLGDVGARPEDRLHPGVFQELIVLLRDHPAADHQDIPAPRRLQRLDQLRRQRLVPRRLDWRCR